MSVSVTLQRFLCNYTTYRLQIFSVDQMITTSSCNLVEEMKKKTIDLHNSHFNGQTAKCFPLKRLSVIIITNFCLYAVKIHRFNGTIGSTLLNRIINKVVNPKIHQGNPVCHKNEYTFSFTVEEQLGSNKS